MSKHWSEVEPKDATNMRLPCDGIVGPLTEQGSECPWPWEPQQLKGVPLGMYHCPYCGDMQIAGIPHTDYRDA